MVVRKKPAPNQDVGQRATPHTSSYGVISNTTPLP